MQRSFRFAAGIALGFATVMLALSTGCEWTGGGGAEQSNDRYNFVNFSGVYKAPDGGILVSDYTSTAAASTTEATAATTNRVNVDGELIAVGNGSATAFSGSFDHDDIVPGSITISAPPAFTLRDNDGDGALEGNNGSSGSINYGAGTFQVSFGGSAIDAGGEIVADYTYLSVSGGSDGSSSSRSSGSSGATIYSFSIEQYGNILNITDNNGARYDGNMGDIRSTSGINQDNIDTRTVLVGDTFVGQYSASGVSAAGMRVNMVGTFEGFVSSVGGDGFILTPRRMYGTWVEDGGKTGNIDGQAGPISISANTTNDTATVIQ